MIQRKLNVKLKPIVVAIDLSYYSTGIAIWNTNYEYTLALVTSKNVQAQNSIVNIYSFSPIANDHLLIGCQVAKIIANVIPKETSLIVFEDLAYGMFRSHEIAQFTGVVTLYLRSICNDMITVSPTTVKKFATNNGRASKQQMICQFEKEVGQYAVSDDVVDAYFIGKYVLKKLLEV